MRYLLFLLLLLGLPFLGNFLRTDPQQWEVMFTFDAAILTNMHAFPELPYSREASIALYFLFFGALVGFLRFLKKGAYQPLELQAAYFPFWGWLAVAGLLIAWGAAWWQPPFFEHYQLLVFPFLWICYIGIVNALTFRRTETCLLTHAPKHVVRLFLWSIPFWWFFEYLNRFVWNWFYLFPENYHWADHLVGGSLAFSTVLPAFASTYEYLRSFSLLQTAFSKGVSINIGRQSRVFASLGVLGMLLIGWVPNFAFPLLWSAPLFLWIFFQLKDGKLPFRSLLNGDYSSLVTAACAALICGFFWELWNVFSLPKWLYAVPWVQGVKIFEMPIVGYLGYLPFGLECLAIVEWIKD